MRSIPESDTYLTLAQAGEGFYKEKGSKFIGHAYPVTSKEEIQECLDALRKQYYDARHHCYAWRLDPEGNQFRANDDGEPNHSAGDPILGQLRSSNLTDTLVVVIRYFGGTKLGVSGLIHAYRTAAADALSETPTQQKIITEPLSFQYPYHRTQEVMRLVDEYPVTITDQQFSEHCAMDLAIPRSLWKPFSESLDKIQEVARIE